MKRFLRLPALALAIASAMTLAAGPAFAQWKATNGPPGYRGSSVVVSGDYLIAGTLDAGLFRAHIDSGSWSPVPYFASVSVQDLMASEGKVYALAGLSGVYRSLDGGVTWTAINHGIESSNIQCLARSPRHLFAGGLESLYRSADDGHTWTEVGRGAFGTWVTALAILGDTVYAGSGGDLHRSVDAGESWTRIVAAALGREVLDIAILGSRLFVGSNTGLHLSRDGGATWTDVSQDNFDMRGDIQAPVELDSRYFVATGEGVFASSDSGSTWTQVKTGFTSNYDEDVRGLAVAGGRLYAATLGGFLRSRKGDSAWSQLHRGMGIGSVHALASTGRDLYAGAQRFVFHSKDTGESWSRLTDMMGSQVYSLAAAGPYVFAGIPGDGVFRFEGVLRTSVSRGLPDSSVRALISTGTYLFAATWLGVSRSPDAGGLWTDASAGLQGSRLRCLAFDGEYLYGGAETGRVFRTLPGTPDWVAVGEGLPGRPVLALGASGTALLAGQDSGLYRSESGGPWVRSDLGLEGRSVFAFLARGEGIFAAGDAGVHRSGDGGRTWVPVNGGLGNLGVSSLAVHQGFLHAGTLTAGIWRRSLQELAVSIAPETPFRRPPGMDGRLRLLPGGWADFGLQRPGRVHLGIYEPSGRKAMDLLRGSLPAGRHRVRLEEVPEGPAILKLDSPDGKASLIIRPVE